MVSDLELHIIKFNPLDVSLTKQIKVYFVRKWVAFSIMFWVYEGEEIPNLIQL